MSSVQEISTCSHCGLKSLHSDLNLRTFNESTLCLACGWGYKNAFNPQTRNYDTQEAGGFGVIIIAAEQGASISPLETAMPEAGALDYLADLEARGHTISVMTICQDGALKFLRGSAREVEVSLGVDEYDFLAEPG